MNRFEFNSNLIDFKNKQDELAHYGTRGQKWGVRKWQNYDGTFNEAGKERYFGKKSSDSSEKMGGLFRKKTPEEKEAKRQERIAKRIDFKVQQAKRLAESYNKKPWHKDKINIDNDVIKGYYEAMYSLPWNKQTHKNAIEEYKKKNGITMTDEDIKNLKKMHDVNSQNRMNQINQLNNQMRQIEQINQINQINQLNQLQQIEQMNQINQLNQLNTLNQINMMNQMMTPGFMGKPEKFGTARNPKMNLKVDPELLKEYTEDEIEDSIQSVVNDIRSKAPEGSEYDPSSYDVTVDKDGSFHIDFHYDDNNSEENSDMSDYETEKMMNREGWESKSVPKYDEHSKEKKIVYSKDIDNDEYEGKKFIIEHDDLSDYGVGNAIDDGDKALKFLNKKGSYQKILNEIADNQYDLYVDVMKDNGKKPVSKSEFIKNEGLKIKEIGLDTYDSFNKGNIIIEFDPKPHSDWFGYEFDVWIDPTTGKYIELYQS